MPVTSDTMHVRNTTDTMLNVDTDSAVIYADIDNHRRRGFVRGRGGRGGHVPLPKNCEEYFSGNYHVKFGSFRANFV